MKSLRTLLKLARRDVETLRRALADQIQRQQTVEDRILGHEATVRAEQQAAVKDYESSRAYGGYAVAAVAMRRALESERGIVAAEIDRLRALIRAALVETRKFERLIELEDAREKAAMEKRENAELDEFATMRSAKGSRGIGQ
jgi:flagellar export protein FliJ